MTIWLLLPSTISPQLLCICTSESNENSVFCFTYSNVFKELWRPSYWRGKARWTYFSWDPGQVTQCVTCQQGERPWSFSDLLTSQKKLAILLDLLLDLWTFHTTFILCICAFAYTFICVSPWSTWLFLCTLSGWGSREILKPTVRCIRKRSGIYMTPCKLNQHIS